MELHENLGDHRVGKEKNSHGMLEMKPKQHPCGGRDDTWKIQEIIRDGEKQISPRLSLHTFRNSRGRRTPPEDSTDQHQLTPQCIQDRNRL